MPVRIGHLSTFYHTSHILMARETLERELPVGVEWKLFGTGPAIVDAFERGELDLAYIGLPPAIIGMARGVNIICIAGGHMEGTVMCGREYFQGYPELVLVQDILSSFKGRTIGVPGKGSIHDVILTDCLVSANLQENIRVRNFPWADLVLEAMVKGDIDAAFGTPALAVAVRRYAHGKVLYPPNLLWPGNPSYGVLAHRDFLRDQTVIAEKFLYYHEEACMFLRDNTDEAAKIIARFVGFVDDTFVAETLRLSPRYCAQLSDKYRTSTMLFVEALKRLGYIDRDIREKEIFDTSLINVVHPQGDHYEST